MDRLKNVAIAALLLTLAEVFLTMTRPGQALASNVASVIVTNFPAVQPVSGTVAVTDSTPLTHVHRPAADLVMLSSACNGAQCSPPDRIDLDGVLASPFAIPSGFALVITDASWTITGESSGVPFSPEIVVAQGCSSAGCTYASPVPAGAQTTDAYGRASGRASWTTGIAVGSTGRIIVGFPVSNENAYGSMQIFGYLVPVH